MITLVSTSLLLLGRGSARSRQETISFSSPLIHFVGRADTRDQKGPKFSWPASTVEFALKGTGFEVKASESGGDFWDVEIDGNPVKNWRLAQGENNLQFDHLASGTHFVRLVKRTESFVGSTQFTALKVVGQLARVQPKKHSIEVIGDSISCGFGNEGVNHPEIREPFKAELENAYLSYGQIAARALNADGTDYAWSGRKMWPDNTIPSIYDLAIPTDPSSTWSFHNPSPDVIVINLATNDFGPGNPDEMAWTGAYQAFIKRLRSHYEKAQIYCAIGSMMGDYDPARHSLSTLRGYLQRMVARTNQAGDHRVRVLEFAQQLESDGIGSMYHPNVKTHQKMADTLVKAIKDDLHW